MNGAEALGGRWSGGVLGGRAARGARLWAQTPEALGRECDVEHTDYSG